MDFWDGLHIDDAYFEKDKFFEAKTNGCKIYPRNSARTR